MVKDPDDKRADLQQIVDDIKALNQDGRLSPQRPAALHLGTGRDLRRGVMTAQQALREIQNLRLTYARPVRHLHEPRRLRPPAKAQPYANPNTAPPTTATQNEILQRLHGATNVVARNKALSDLVAHADRNRDLIEEATCYQTAQRQLRLRVVTVAQTL